MQHPLAEGLSIVRSTMAATGKEPRAPWLMWAQYCEAWEATVPGLIKHPRDPNVCANGQPDPILDAVRMGIFCGDELSGRPEAVTTGCGDHAWQKLHTNAVPAVNHILQLGEEERVDTWNEIDTSDRITRESILAGGNRVFI